MLGTLLCASQIAANVPLSLTPAGGETPLTLPAEITLALPGEHNFEISLPDPTAWLGADSVDFTIEWPADAPPQSRAMMWFKDRDHYWHQNLLPAPLTPGTTNLLSFACDSNAEGWQAPGYSIKWHQRIKLNPISVGIRIFADTPCTNKCVLVSATLITKPSTTPPIIHLPGALTRTPQVLELYEARFDLPDRYTNPFDPAEIDAGAYVATPDGTTNTIHAFYYQPHYRLEDEVGKPVEPAGRPEWRLRYCPRTEGNYTISLYAKDKFGSVVLTNALKFTAVPAAEDAQRFIRVSKIDPRFFEFDDGALYYPVGHNVRSASDARMDDKFPWIFRHDEGTTTYRSYFSKMQQAGENWAEVWMSAWSLGLEWTEGISRYHGAGDYHMGHAWELDHVMDLARKHRIYVNLVLNYHGRISSWCDPEWHLHPYNKATPGGWLTMPLEFFSDPRAIEMQKRFCRYTQARWGWSPNIFGYELCSEINLTGHETHHRTHFDPSVVTWCRVLGEYFREIDPYRHLVSSHISNDYRLLNPEICKLEVMDFIPLDAYHHTQPERIIRLTAETADISAQYNKPMLITEFGGSPMAAGLEHLKIELHSALWAGACAPLSGTPMLWWWQVIDENNLYHEFTSFRHFIEDVDPRNPQARTTPVALSGSEKAPAPVVKSMDAFSIVAPESARAYIFTRRFPRGDEPAREIEGLTATLSGLTPGIFRVQIYDTSNGKVVRKFDLRTTEANLAVPLPRFKNDCAVKATLLTPLAKK